MLNTHLDHKSDEQRRLGASLLLRRAWFEAATTENPVFLLGDFNRWDVFAPKFSTLFS